MRSGRGALALVRRVAAHVGLGHVEDEPPIAHIGAGELELVPEKGPQGLWVRGVEHRVDAADHDSSVDQGDRESILPAHRLRVKLTGGAAIDSDLYSAASR